jgi:ABC-type amino acid transport substrate-binding protein
MADPSVFISYATTDREIAWLVCEDLEARGMTCWIAPRDVPPGMDYGQAIVDGIKKSRVMVVLLSEDSGCSRYVAREVERAVTHQVALLPVRLATMDIPASLEFFLGSCQWLDLLPPASDRDRERLGDSVARMLHGGPARRETPLKSRAIISRRLPFGKIAAAIGVLGLAVGLVYGWKVRRHLAHGAENPAASSGSGEGACVALTSPGNGVNCLGTTQLEWSEEGLAMERLEGFDVEIVRPGTAATVSRIGIRYSYPLQQISGEIAWRVRPVYRDGDTGRWSGQRKLVKDQDVLARILRTHELHFGHAESGNNFINGESATLSGFDVDLARELVTRILRRRDPNAKLTFVPHASRWTRICSDGKPERFLNLLRRDEGVDLLASGISITAERQREGLAFTAPVLTYPQTLITLKGTPGLVDGKPGFLHLGAVDGTTNVALARQMQKLIPELEVIAFTGSGAHEKMLKALVETREIEAGLADKPLALRKIKNFQGDGADAEFSTCDIKEFAGQAVPIERIGFVLRPGDTTLREELDREIAASGELRRDLVKKYFPMLDPEKDVP